jgi:hypothetical protein
VLIERLWGMVRGFKLFPTKLAKLKAMFPTAKLPGDRAAMILGSGGYFHNTY